MGSISAVIIALDEEARIARAVHSVLPWVDEVLVLDGGSCDSTVAMATEAGATVRTHLFDGFVAQKQRAVDHARYDWVFLLDADESVDPVLGSALREASESSALGFRVHRWNYLDGQPLLGAGWGSDRPLRLFDRRAARVVGQEPHDRVEVQGRTARLPGVLHHDVDRDTRAYVRATVAHARRASGAIAERGRPAAVAPWVHGAAHFARKCIWGAAPLHGRRGWTVAWVGALGAARKYRLARRIAR